MPIISSIESKLATVARDAVKAAQFVEQKVLPVLQKANADASTIESITGLVSPQAASIEAAAFTVLGVVIKAVEDAETAAGSSGLSVSLDAALVADLKAIAPAFTAALAAAKK